MEATNLFNAQGLYVKSTVGGFHPWAYTHGKCQVISNFSNIHWGDYGIWNKKKCRRAAFLQCAKECSIDVWLHQQWAETDVTIWPWSWCSSKIERVRRKRSTWGSNLQKARKSLRFSEYRLLVERLCPRDKWCRGQWFLTLTRMQMCQSEIVCTLCGWGIKVSVKCCGCAHSPENPG